MRVKNVSALRLKLSIHADITIHNIDISAAVTDFVPQAGRVFEA
jgi:hypothetical protein